MCLNVERSLTSVAGKAGSNALPPMLWPLPLLPGPSVALALRARPSGLVMLGSCLAFAPGALVPDHSWRNYAGRVFNELRM